VASGGIDATLNLPGSKSITNRWLVIAALSDQTTVLGRPLRARDTELMAAALQALGCSIEWRTDTVSITPASEWGSADIDCGLAGNVMRFVPAISGLAQGVVRFDGDPRARERPIAPLLAALRHSGAVVDDGGRGALPFSIEGRGHIRGGDVPIDGTASSQFVTAMLLAGCRYDEGLQLRHIGNALPSRPHIQMTLRLLELSSVDVMAQGEGEWIVKPGIPRVTNAVVEPDLSNAFAFFCAALATRGTCTVADFSAMSVQPTHKVQEIVQAFGGTFHQGSDFLSVSASDTPRGIDLDLGDVGELVPNVAAIAAIASSPSRIRGVAHLRGHETDRLAALVAELSSLGCDIAETVDGLTIHPRPLSGGLFRTYHDHRMATSGALIGLTTPGVEVEDIATTGKTLPDFPALWRQMLGTNDVGQRVE